MTPEEINALVSQQIASSGLGSFDPSQFMAAGSFDPSQFMAAGSFDPSKYVRLDQYSDFDPSKYITHDQFTQGIAGLQQTKSFSGRSSSRSTRNAFSKWEQKYTVFLMKKFLFTLATLFCFFIKCWRSRSTNRHRLYGNGTDNCENNNLTTVNSTTTTNTNNNTSTATNTNNNTNTNANTNVNTTTTTATNATNSNTNNNTSS